MRYRRMAAAAAGGMAKTSAIVLPPPTLDVMTTTVPFTSIVDELIFETWMAVRDATRAAVRPRASSRAFTELLNAHGGFPPVVSHKVSWHIVSNQPSIPLFWMSSCQFAAALVANRTSPMLDDSGELGEQGS
jgi:hypothetical protein